MKNDPETRRENLSKLFGSIKRHLNIFKGFKFDYPKRIGLDENFFQMLM